MVSMVSCSAWMKLSACAYWKLVVASPDRPDTTVTASVWSCLALCFAGRHFYIISTANPHALSSESKLTNMASSSASEDTDDQKTKTPYVRQIVWKNVALFIYLHLAAVYGLYLVFTSAHVNTVIFGNFGFLTIFCLTYSHYDDDGPIAGCWSKLHWVTHGLLTSCGEAYFTVQLSIVALEVLFFFFGVLVILIIIPQTWWKGRNCTHSFHLFPIARSARSGVPNQGEHKNCVKCHII